MTNKNDSRTSASLGGRKWGFLSLATLAALAALATSCAVNQDGADESMSDASSAHEALTARADLTVSLRMQRANFRASDAQTLTFSITNSSAVPQRVLKWTTPLGGIEHDVFALSSATSGVSYIGPLVKRGAPQESDYVVLAPGQTLSSQVDLSTAYDVHEVGQYTVEYVGGTLPVTRLAAGKSSFRPFQPRLRSSPRR